ncbi:MAG: hypothetical protein PHV02_13945 [Rhodocyclaceae bacterium]|nr:hypothetical protein [Rhodocyclaceae bacterium]
METMLTANCDGACAACPFWGKRLMPRICGWNWFERAIFAEACGQRGFCPGFLTMSLNSHGLGANLRAIQIFL